MKNSFLIETTTITMYSPKVTVGIPVFNGDQFLRQSIESVVNQSYVNIEIIISDNCSTDNTKAICLEFAGKDDRIRYIRRPKNYGSINNFVFLLSEARGQYFMWAGADDFFDKNWIGCLLDIASTSDNSIAFGVVQYVDELGAKINSTANCHQFNYVGPVWWRRISYIFTPWAFGKMILCWGLFPKELLIDVTKETFISKWGGAVDSIWVYCVLSKCNIKSSCSVSLYKRVHKSSESATLEKQVKRDIFGKLFGFVRTALKVNMFSNFLSLSPSSLKFTLLLLSPFFYVLYVFRSLWILMLYKIQKSSEF